VRGLVRPGIVCFELFKDARLTLRLTSFTLCARVYNLPYLCVI